MGAGAELRAVAHARLDGLLGARCLVGALPAPEPSITLSGTVETTDDLAARVDASLALRTDIAIVTNDITAVGSDYEFRGGCRRSDQATAPSAGGTGAPSAEPQPAPDQHAIAAATQPLTCADLFPT